MSNKIAFLIPFIGSIALYVLAIVALVYVIKVLRIYIKKNSE